MDLVDFAAMAPLRKLVDICVVSAQSLRNSVPNLLAKLAPDHDRWQTQPALLVKQHQRFIPVFRDTRLAEDFALF